MKKHLAIVVAVAMLIVACVTLIVRQNQKSKPRCRRKVKRFEHEFKSGDLLLSESGALHRIVGGIPWQHAALVFRDPDTGLLYVWDVQIPHLGTIGTLTTSVNIRGCRLTPLKRYLARCKKNICVRPINRPVDEHKMKEFILKNYNRPFAFECFGTNAHRLIPGLFTSPPMKDTSKRKGRYCAELVYETLAHVGVLNPDLERAIQPKYVIPDDFSEHRENIPYADPSWRFEPEILLI